MFEARVRPRGAEAAAQPPSWKPVREAAEQHIVRAAERFEVSGEREKAARLCSASSLSRVK